MGKNEKDRQPGLIYPPKNWQIHLGGFIYLAAFFTGGAVVIHDMACSTLYAEETSGHDKWVYTIVLGIGTAFFAFLGMLLFMQQHMNGWYIKVEWYPPVYTIFLLLWIVEFGMYAVPFLHADDHSPTIRAVVCMKHIIWTSVAGMILWTIILFMSIVDWRKYGKHKWINRNSTAEQGGVSASGGSYHNGQGVSAGGGGGGGGGGSSKAPAPTAAPYPVKVFTTAGIEMPHYPVNYV